MKKEVFKEITPLSHKDCFLIFKRTKKKFDFPLHTHSDFELNFIEGANKARRIVGDNVETIGDSDLTLITSPDLEHVWISHECTSTEVSELTIQFHPDLIGEHLLSRNQFRLINNLFIKAKLGVTFSDAAITIIKPLLEELSKESKGMNSILQFINIIHQLSLFSDSRVLASENYHDRENTPYNSRRIERAYKYIHENYQSRIYLKDVADLIGMNEISFSRFVKARTGKSFIDVLIDIRIGHASKMLIDTTHSIAEVCFSCGFNNLSNFNRSFRKKKECTPKEFRENYSKNRFLL